jgi:hypothetical protein
LLVHSESNADMSRVVPHTTLMTHVHAYRPLHLPCMNE